MATGRNYTVQLASVLGWAAVFSHRSPGLPPQREICTTHGQLVNFFFSTEENNKSVKRTHTYSIQMWQRALFSRRSPGLLVFSFLPAIKLPPSSPSEIIAEIWFGKVGGNIFGVLNLSNFDLIIDLTHPGFAVCLFVYITFVHGLRWQIFPGGEKTTLQLHSRYLRQNI